jgi:hypothetical protein
MQVFYNNTTHVSDSGFRFFDKPGGSTWNAYLYGDSWVTPFQSPPWSWVVSHPGNNKYKRDTVITSLRFMRVNDPRWDSIRALWTYNPWSSGRPILPGAQPHVNGGDFVDSSYFVKTGFFTGAESTRGNQGTKLGPRRLNPDRDLHAVSYVWRLGAGTAPRGLGPAIGKLLFPRSSVAPPCPMLTVARAEPYLTRDDPTEEDYFFAPDWDVRLTPLDSAGVQDICNDTAYGSHSLDSLNLEDLRRYVLLP